MNTKRERTNTTHERRNRDADACVLQRFFFSFFFSGFYVFLWLYFVLSSLPTTLTTPVLPPPHREYTFTGQVQVEGFHRHHLAVAAPRCAAFHPKSGTLYSGCVDEVVIIRTTAAKSDLS